MVEFFSKEFLHKGENIRSINWHLWAGCNYGCKFCFATFKEVRKNEKKYLEPEKGRKLIYRLWEQGMEKITFVGGEPFLCPWLGDYVVYAKKLGVTTMIVTNGSLLDQNFLETYGWAIDWIGLSIDSGNEMTEKLLGRGNGDHLDRIIQIRKLLDGQNICVKVNVTVTRLVLEEDLHPILVKLRPDRLKFFQVLPIEGENDGKVEPFLINNNEFQSFINRHMDLNPVAEDNDAMLGSYLMVDPLGRFFQNTSGRLVYSDPILQVGIQRALEQVGFDWEKFVKRGGLYYEKSDLGESASIEV